MISFPAVAQPGDLAIALRRDVAKGRPVLAMRITNRSKRPICVLTELLGNPDTGEVVIALRDAGGRPIRINDMEGYIPRPLDGVIRLAPGESTRAHYYLDGRFRWPGRAGLPLPRSLSAQATFSYGPCDNVRSLRATSSWQGI